MRGSSGLRVDDILVFGSSGSGDGYGICLWFGRFWEIPNPVFSDPSLFVCYFFCVLVGGWNLEGFPRAPTAQFTYGLP